MVRQVIIFHLGQRHHSVSTGDPLDRGEQARQRFLAHPGRAYSRDQLLEALWGEQRYVTPRTVDVHVRRLREQIEEQPDEPRHLVTVRGFGYRFEESA